MRTLGNLMVLVGLVAGLALAVFLYQWDTVQREASATPVGSAAASGTNANGAVPGADEGAGGAIQNGKVVYNKFCNSCHPNGKAGVGPAIVGVSEGSLRTIVRQGIGGMPAFGEGQISEEQLAELSAYIKSLK